MAVCMSIPGTGGVPTQVRLAAETAGVADSRKDATPSPVLDHALVLGVVNRQQSSPQEARGENEHHNLGEYLDSR